MRGVRWEEEPFRRLKSSHARVREGLCATQASPLVRSWVSPATP